MSSTLKIQSFSEANLRERTQLAAPVLAGASLLPVESTQGYVVGQTLYVGTLSREGCEPAVIAAIPSPTSVTTVSPLKYAHNQFEPVTGVLGDLIHVYRAVNVDGTPPPPEMYAVLATRSIDPDQTGTYYTDPAGSSSFWYRTTNYSASTLEETSLMASPPVRGDDFGHYASLSAIRADAGFTGAQNLSDVDVDAKRREAEAEINATLGGYLTVPFVKPIPDIVQTVTIRLAAGLLMNWAYPSERPGEAKIKDARAQLLTMQSGATSVDGGTGANAVASGVSGYPDDSEQSDRMFSVGMKF